MNTKTDIFLIFCVAIEASLAGFISRGTMQYRVEMEVFSGRSSPTWIVDSKNPYFSRIAYGLAKTLPSRMSDRLGYRGFSVEMSNPFGQRRYKTIAAGSNPMMEMLLLNSSPYPIEPLVRQSVIDTIQRRKSMAPPYTLLPKVYPGKQRPLPVCQLPIYDPTYWNMMPTVRLNNCYNYATQRLTNTFAQPGRASGVQFQRPIMTEDVLAATIRDGFVPLPYYTPRYPTNTCVIALVIWPGVDYHFFRLDNNLLWSHKSGRTPARNTDESGSLIADPGTANRGNYIVFAGYLGNSPSARVI